MGQLVLLASVCSRGRSAPRGAGRPEGRLAGACAQWWCSQCPGRWHPAFACRPSAPRAASPSGVTAARRPFLPPAPTDPRAPPPAGPIGTSGRCQAGVGRVLAHLSCCPEGRLFHGWVGSLCQQSEGRPHRCQRVSARSGDHGAPPRVEGGHTDLQRPGKVAVAARGDVAPSPPLTLFSLPQTAPAAPPLCTGRSRSRTRPPRRWVARPTPGPSAARR